MSKDNIIVVSTESVQAGKPADAQKEQTAEAANLKADQASESIDQEQEPKEGAETDGQDDVDTDDDAESKEAAKNDETGKPKKKSGAQRQKEKIARLEQELQAIRNQVLQPAKNESADLRTQDAKQTDNGKPNPDNFETLAEYTDALTDWKIEQREKAQAAKILEEKIKAEGRTLQETHNKRCETFAEKTKDFKETMDNFVEEMRGITIPMSLDTAVMESELGPELLYEFAKNPDEFKRICDLSDRAMLKEIGKIEARLSKSSNEKTTEAKLTKAPKPIAPVSAGTTSSGKKSIFDPDISQAEYEAIRREQMKRSSSW